MAQADDSPYSLRSEVERARRKTLLDEPHMGSLTAFVQTIRDETGEDVPFFDPLDGGVSATCLFLLEAPGSRAVSSGFVSRNNPDVSARNFFELNREAGIPRTKTVIWNIVPWYIGSGEKIRPANNDDIEEGLRYLDRLIPLLPNLRIVVTMGQKANRAEKYLTRVRPLMQTVQSPHPSPLYINRQPGNRDKILTALKNVALQLAVF